MKQYDFFIEKLGMNKFDNINNKVKKSFDDVADQKVRQELKLIQQVQFYKDFFAEERLLSMYRGQISNLVNKSRAKQAVGYDLAYQLAVGALKTAIRNFDLSKYKNNKPITYFTNSINFELDKLYKKETSQNTIHISSDLNSYKNNIANAESILTPQLGRTPTNEEVLGFIQKDMGFAPGLNLKKIERIKHYNTKELSGSAVLGKENASGAETLTFEDVMNTTEDVDKIITDEIMEDKIIDTIREFTENKNERRFLMAYLGIGEFKNLNVRGSANKSCIQTGIPYHISRKLLDSFRKFCNNKGVI